MGVLVCYNAGNRKAGSGLNFTLGKLGFGSKMTLGKENFRH